MTPGMPVRRVRASRAGLLLAGCALVLAAAPLSAQDTAHVRGTVVSASTGEPLARATVSIVGDARFTIADAAGRFRIEGLRGGAIVLRARLLGDRVEERRVVVPTGGAAEVAFRLGAMPLSLSPVRTQAQLTERERLEAVPEVGTVIIAGGVARTLQ